LKKGILVVGLNIEPELGLQPRPPSRPFALAKFPHGKHACFHTMGHFCTRKHVLFLVPWRWISDIAGHFARLERFRGPQAVAKVLWAVARAQALTQDDRIQAADATCVAASDPQPLLSALAPAVLETLPVAEAQQVANILWAYARLAARHEHAVLQAAGLRIVSPHRGISAAHCERGVGQRKTACAGSGALLFSG
jgi:hypothetical protein